MVPWTLMYSSFTVFWILIQKVLIRLLPYLTYKFNINERVDVNQDGPSLIPPPPNRLMFLQMKKMIIYCFSLLYLYLQCDEVFMTL